MGAANGRKSIFVTGAASGMGRETARLFASKGWFVGAADVNAEGLVSLEAELGSANCLTGVLDVSDRAAYRDLLDVFAAQTDAKLDFLYNNAGIGKGGPFDQQPFEDVLSVIQVNLIGVLNGIHLATPLLKATPNSVCFTTSSSSATYGMPGIAVYSATKHAVKGLTEALAAEYKAYGIRVADVLPGLIDTPLLPPGVAQAAPKTGMFRAIPPIEVAKVAWRAYHEDRVHWYVPEEMFELDKQATLDPVRVRDMMASGSLFRQLTDLSAGTER